LASSNFEKHGLIAIIFGKQHQHTFKNDIQLSLYLHFYLLYFVVSSCNGNDAFWHHSVLVKKSSIFSRNIGLYLFRSVSARQSRPKLDWLQKFGTDAGTCVQCTLCKKTPICERHWLEAVPLWQMGKHITKRHRRSSWSMEKVVMCKH